MSNQFQNPDLDGISSSGLAVALIGPHDARRRIVANALAGTDVASIREFSAYPSKLEDAARSMEQDYDVVIIDLDSDQNYALQLVEAIATCGAVTVMVYSMNPDPNLLMSCMRAGAREFFFLTPSSRPRKRCAGARLIRRPASRGSNRSTTSGKVVVFLGGKAAQASLQWPATLPFRWYRSASRMCF